MNMQGIAKDQAETSASPQTRLMMSLQTMTRDLEIRACCTADAVRHLQGIEVAKQFLDQTSIVVREFGGQEGRIMHAPESELLTLRERLEKNRVNLLEAMSAARCVRPSAWVWPEVTVTESAS